MFRFFFFLFYSLVQNSKWKGILPLIVLRPIRRSIAIFPLRARLFNFPLVKYYFHRWFYNRGCKCRKITLYPVGRTRSTRSLPFDSKRFPLLKSRTASSNTRVKVMKREHRINFLSPFVSIQSLFLYNLLYLSFLAYKPLIEYSVTRLF